MAKFGLFLLLLAAQSFLSSGAFVRNSLAESNLRRQAKPASNTLTFSQSIWNNTITNLVQRDIEMVKSKPPMVNKIYYVVLTMILGMCGCDRCFMGQICLGVVKGLTLGGLGLWQFLDYVVCCVNALQSEPDIHTMGYHATFTKDSIGPSFYLCAVFLTLQVINYCNTISTTRQQIKMQQEQQEALMKAMMEANAQGAKSQNASDEPQEGLDIPMRHQSLAYIPTAFTKGLRKAGIVTEKPTIPELIAAFDQMDKDGDVQLDHEEIKEAMAAMGIDDDAVDEMIKAADTDGDGKISKNEFLIANANK
jgi:hypothetical protein